MEFPGVIEEDDCPVAAERFRRTRKNRQRFDERELTGLGRCWLVFRVAESQGFDRARRGEDIACNELLATIEHDADGAVAIHLNVANARAQLQLATQCAELADEIFQD